jgi:hypothetical protein
MVPEIDALEPQLRAAPGSIWDGNLNRCCLKSDKSDSERRNQGTRGLVSLIYYGVCRA